MTTILRRIRNLLGLRQPEQAEKGKVTEMESMMEMKPRRGMESMSGMEPMQEHQSDDMAANPGGMGMTHGEPEERQMR